MTRARERIAAALVLWLTATAPTPAATAAGWTTESDVELGHLYSAGRRGAPARNLPYALGSFRLERELSDVSRLLLQGGFRAEYDFDRETGPAPDDSSDIVAARGGAARIEELYARYTRDWFDLAIGFQQISWGETFGLFIADVVNPRDLSDPLHNDLAWVRIPVFALNAQVLRDRWSLQGVFVPVPRNMEFPEFPGFEEVEVSAPGNAEWGGRLGYLTESGLDLRALFYSHWNRNPVFEITSGAGSFSPSLRRVVRRVTSTGLSGSYAAGDVVLRGDVLLHLRRPVATHEFGGFRRVSWWQGILGADLVTGGGWTIGGQYHVDLWSPETGETGPDGKPLDRDLHSVSARVSRGFLDGALEPAVFYFHGLDSRDRWLQPQLAWRPADGLEVTLRYDWIHGASFDQGGFAPGGGLLGTLGDSDRFLSRVSWRF